jgi:indolepyruvate ferredoxin oxidoreductase, beta subunit
MKYDIFFAGVGGQGILTIGEVLAEVAEYKDIPANFYPSKGMAQRGGFVKAQLRLGRQNVGSNIPQLGADMVIAMEQSESLKAIPFIKKGGDFVLYGDIWAPTAVSLGKAPYPTLEQVKEQVALSGARLVYIDPVSLPKYAGEPVHPNLFVLGVIIGQTTLGSLVDSNDVEHIIQSRFKRNVEANLYAYHSGLGQLQVNS